MHSIGNFGDFHACTVTSTAMQVKRSRLKTKGPQLELDVHVSLAKIM